MIKVSDNKEINSKKVAIIFTSAIIIFLTVISIFFVYNHINDATISILVAPQSATVKVDNTIFGTNSEGRIPSGKHTITVSKEGFETKTDEIEIKSGETYYYFNYLTYPNDSMEWYTTHKEDSDLLESIIPEMSLIHAKTIKDTNPLIGQLPINIDEYDNEYSKLINYSISYKINVDDSVTIMITDYSGNNKEKAYDKIKTLGFNPDDYYILYYDESEPDGWGKALDE